MRRLAAIGVCVLVAGCGGGSDQPKQAATVRPATQAAQSSVEVSIHGSDTRRVKFGKSVTIKGAIRPGDDPAIVHLLASEYPYRSSEPVESKTTGDGGAISFTEQPRLNTRYSVQVEAASGPDRVSRPVQVYVLPDGNFRVEPIASQRGFFIYEISYPTEVAPTKRPVQFYAHLVGDGGEFTRVGEARLRPTGSASAIARAAITLPGPADDAVACVPTMIAPNFGDPPIPDCGKEHVRVPRH